MKVLITGAAGFIGSYLARALIWRGNDVVGIDSFNDYYGRRCKEFNLDLIYLAAGGKAHTFKEKEVLPVYEKINSYFSGNKSSTPGSFRFHTCDILDYELLTKIFSQNKFDAVIHLAAMAGVPRSKEQPEFYSKVNVEGTTNLLNLSVKNEVGRFVFGSTASVYGDYGGSRVTEEQRTSPSSVYGATKVAGEVLCNSFHQTFGLNVFIARIFGPIYGPLQRPYGMLAQRTINYVFSGKTLSIYGKNGLETAKDNTYIDDQVKGIILCLENCNGFDIFNIGTSEPKPIRELLQAVSESVGQEVKHQITSPDNADTSVSADITKARNKIGYVPTMEFKEGIRRQVEVFKLMPQWYREMDV